MWDEISESQSSLVKWMRGEPETRTCTGREKARCPGRRRHGRTWEGNEEKRREPRDGEGGVGRTEGGG